jgi:LysM domain
LTRTPVRAIIEHVFGIYVRRRLAFVLVLVTLVLGGLRFAASSSGAGPAVRYDVVPGDTLWSIAASHYDGDPRAEIDSIRSANHLQTDLIVPGQVLLLPAGA